MQALLKTTLAAFLFWFSAYASLAQTNSCDAVTPTSTSNSINLTGLSNTNIVQVFNNNYSANVFKQTTSSTSLTIPNLTSGQKYHVKFSQYIQPED